MGSWLIHSGWVEMKALKTGVMHRSDKNTGVSHVLTLIQIQLFQFPCNFIINRLQVGSRAYVATWALCNIWPSSPCITMKMYVFKVKFVRIVWHSTVPVKRLKVSWAKIARNLLNISHIWPRALMRTPWNFDYVVLEIRYLYWVFFPEYSSVFQWDFPL